MEEQNIRPLTKVEKFEWYVGFLEEEIATHQHELRLAKEALIKAKEEELQSKVSEDNAKVL